MSDYTDQLLSLSPDDSGKVQLVGASFVGESFPELVFGPASDVDREYCIEDTRFERCNVVQGQFAIERGVVMRNVVFDEVSSPDLLAVSTHTVLDHVTMSGNPKLGGIWIRPDEVFDKDQDSRFRQWATGLWSEIDVMLDISDYWGPEVEVLGLPPEKVRFDSSRHIIVEQSWNDRINWTEIGLKPISFWRRRLSRLNTFGVDSGIFQIPTVDQQKHKQAMEELSKLRDFGVV